MWAGVLGAYRGASSGTGRLPTLTRAAPCGPPPNAIPNGGGSSVTNGTPAAARPRRTTSVLGWGPLGANSPKLIAPAVVPEVNPTCHPAASNERPRLMANQRVSVSLESYSISTPARLPRTAASKRAAWAGDQGRHATRAFNRSCSNRASAASFSSWAARSVRRAASVRASSTLTVAVVAVALASAILLSASACMASDALLASTVERNPVTTATPPAMAVTQSSSWLNVCNDCVESVHIPVLPAWLWFIPLGLWLFGIFGFAAHIAARRRHHWRKLAQPSVAVRPGVRSW